MEQDENTGQEQLAFLELAQAADRISKLAHALSARGLAQPEHLTKALADLEATIADWRDNNPDFPLYL